jgi:hypothetical protein
MTLHLRQRFLATIERAIGDTSPYGSNGSETHHQEILFFASALVLSILGIVWGATYILLQQPHAGLFAILYSILSWIDFLIYRHVRRYKLFRFNQLVLIMLLPFMVTHWPNWGFAFH